jgi:hypothetical protein
MDSDPDTDRRNVLALEEGKRLDANLRAAEWQGYIDAVEGGRIYGWAINPRDMDERLSVELYHGSKLLDTVVADRYREDLVSYGNGSGRHAFVFTLPRDIWNAPASQFSARFHNTDIPLLRNKHLAVQSKTNSAGTNNVEEPAQDAEAEDGAAALNGVTDRLDSLERLSLSLMKLFDPRSEVMHKATEESSATKATLRNFEKNLAVMEANNLRLDQRLVELEEDINSLRSTGQGKGNLFAHFATVLLVCTLGVFVYFLLEFLLRNSS